ncbi:NAD(P)H-binding protein [Streptomyces sp. PKU-EA00015]|uniref:NAD(P)-dependent oxidoreductase n=1 Tax=Streptomyces sp. PKU-EA00015 TaxID=2748326 RepID=UPI0015A251A8|nr:NAD(P)H-binding protein [Streptomyces sp. PKU-EA00015]NWF25548.1 NAD(P)H-binding protein [Streptomyces sp. PKU-EA00015]
MRLVVLGANGPTGRWTTAQAIAEGHTVTAVTRRPDAFPLDGPRLRVIGADVYDSAAVEQAVAGQDAVISALGVPYTRRPVTVCSRGLSHIVGAMNRQEVRRLVWVTSTVLFDTEAPGESLLFRKVVEPLVVRSIGRTVYEDMRRMERIVRDSDHEWTVVRPAGLFDAHTVSHYRTSTARLPGRCTSRADLGDALLRQATGAGHLRACIDVRTTENTPSPVALLRKEVLGKS